MHIACVYSGRPINGSRSLYRQELEPDESELPEFPAMNLLVGIQAEDMMVRLNQGYRA
jgi:hypothetical protein